MRDEGRCTTCGEPAKPGTQRCALHHEQIRQLQRRRIAELRSEGQCTTCVDGKARSGLTTCAECAEVQSMKAKLRYEVAKFAPDGTPLRGKFRPCKGCGVGLSDVTKVFCTDCEEEAEKADERQTTLFGKAGTK